MAGETKLSQLNTATPISFATLEPGAIGTASIPWCSFHTVPAGVTGNPDDVLLINAAMPVASHIIFSLVFVSVGVAGATGWVQLCKSAGGADAISATHLATAAMNSGNGSLAGNVVAKNGSVYLRRGNDNVACTVLIFWGTDTAAAIVTTGAAKALQIAPLTVEMLADSPVAGQGITYATIHELEDEGGGADEVNLMTPIKRKSKLMMAFYHATTAVVGTVTVKIAGGGAALSTALDTNVNFAFGISTGAASAGNIVAARTESTATGLLVCLWYPTA